MNIRGMHQLVALDISEIPSLRLIAEKYLPLRYFAMDGQSDLPKKTQLEENIKLNMGKIVPTIDIKKNRNRTSYCVLLSAKQQVGGD